MALETETAETEVVEAESTGEVVSLSEMFNESEVEVSEVTEVAAVAETEDDPGAVEAVAETEVAEPPAAEQGQLAAMLAERDKRKVAEARVKELEAEREPESQIDPIEDPEGYRNKIESDRVQSDLRTKIT